MTTREKIFCMFLSDEDRGISPGQRAFYTRLNENYHTLFYEPWKEYMKPFPVAGNVYYIGNRLVSIHLIVTPEGLIVYDAGFQHTMPLLMKAITDLGFRPEQIRYVILTHGHFDHYGSAAWMQGLYGAKVCMGAEEKDRLDIPRFGTIPRDDYSLDAVEADILLHTGDEISLGGYTLKFYETPGHSAGSIAAFMDTEESGKKLRVCFYGDGGVGMLGKPNPDYPEEAVLDHLRAVREEAFRLMSEEHADVFTAGHPHTLGYNALQKAEAWKANPGSNPFINAEDWKRAFSKECEAYETLIREERDRKD